MHRTATAKRSLRPRGLLEVFLLALLCGCTGPALNADGGALDGISRQCGGESSPCCTDTPWCTRGLRCVDAICRRPPRQCTHSGIADPALVAVDISYSAAPDCTDVPAELRNTSTPGTYAPDSDGIGQVDCVGLTPGTAWIDVVADVRLLEPGRNEPGNCWCSQAWNVGLVLVVEGGDSMTLAPDRTQDLADTSCRAGPHFAAHQPVVVDDSGLLSVRLDLRACTRDNPTHCLFIRGTSFDVTQ